MLFLILSFFLLTSAILVISCQNPVHSVFFLVLVFLISAFLLFLLEIEFISLLFIMVYVGAIAVLFLFVVMMLDIKINNSEKDFQVYLPIGLVLGLAFFLEIYLIYQDNFQDDLQDVGFENTLKIHPDVLNNLGIESENMYVFTDYTYTDWLTSVDTITNVEVLGQILYTYYFFYFLIAGMILLVAMLGAIVLTLNFSQKAKHQFVFKQILRKKNNSVFLTTNS
jgi:NADH-quinone oxidoreductase subunit J